MRGRSRAETRLEVEAVLAMRPHSLLRGRRVGGRLLLPRLVPREAQPPLLQSALGVVVTAAHLQSRSQGVVAVAGAVTAVRLVVVPSLANFACAVGVTFVAKPDASSLSTSIVNSSRLKHSTPSPRIV